MSEVPPSSAGNAAREGASPIHFRPASAFSSRALGLGTGSSTSAAHQAQRSEARVEHRYAAADGLRRGGPEVNPSVRTSNRHGEPPKGDGEPQGEHPATQPSGLSLPMSTASIDASRAACSEVVTCSGDNKGHEAGTRSQPQSPAAGRSHLATPPPGHLPSLRSGDAAPPPLAASMAPPLGCRPQDLPHATSLMGSTYLTGGVIGETTSALRSLCGSGGMGSFPAGGSGAGRQDSITHGSPQTSTFSAAGSSSASGSPRWPPQLQLPLASGSLTSSPLSRPPGTLPPGPRPLSPGEGLPGSASPLPVPRTPSGQLHRLQGRGHHLRALRRSVDAALRQVWGGGRVHRAAVYILCLYASA